MKHSIKKVISVLLAAAVISGTFLFAFADGGSPLNEDAYASIVTGSDLQGTGSEAYDRFGRILAAAKKDGLSEVDSVLIGGDYTKLLFDNAIPGISRVRHEYLNAFPDADPASVVCIQGNHDNTKEEFAETGFYDMGTYCLYAINENSFPWKQNLRSGDKVEKLAADIEEKLDGMIEKGDMRPVILMTHVPLHYTSRSGGKDNIYSSYIFDVINEKAEKLDIIFLFGHNHSGKYDDYIGGSVNFMKPGDIIRIPDKNSENGYAEKTLNFTYTNCGYLGYSDNSVTETSTNVLTMGIIQFSSDSFRFIKYSEDGLYFSADVERINKNTDTFAHSYPAIDCTCICHSDNSFLKTLWNIWLYICNIFGINQYCACGTVHSAA